MDVSRIGPISPKQIDWRRLTAKEIIKYNQEGVEVPTQYLQWAQEFRKSLDSDDVTTYEMAKSSTAVTTPQTETPVATTEEVPAQEGSESTTETDNPEEEEKNAAQLKRQEMQASGVSLRTQAQVFTADSRENSSDVLQSAALISSVETQSVDEIQNLENYMNELLAKAEAAQAEFKREIANINDDKSDKTTFGKINKLQKELEQYGIQGQSQISASEVEMSEYESTLNAQSGVITNAVDFGVETVDIGNELIASTQDNLLFRIFDRIIGYRAVRVGGQAEDNGQRTAELQAQTLSTNSDNMSAANSLKSEVESKTGVAGNESPKDAKNSEENTESDKAEDSQEDVKTAQNDGTDDTAKASTNIDEILKRKIRKGENPDNPPPTA